MISGWKETGSSPLLKTACAHTFLRFPEPREWQVGEIRWIGGRPFLHTHDGERLTFDQADNLIKQWEYHVQIDDEGLNPDYIKVQAMYSAYPERNSWGEIGYLFRLG